MDFNALNLNAELRKGIANLGFTDCTEVQEKTFAVSLSGRDVCVQSQTGTGKTAAFLITIFQRLLAEPDLTGKQTLVIVPTRELAVQIEEEAKALGRHLAFTIGSFYGGVGYATQEKLLKDGVDLMICTPGRLLDYLQSGKVNFKRMGFLVIDEADRLFDMGFLPDIRRILKKMPADAPRQTMLFSATLSPLVRNIASEYMRDAVEIVVSPQQMTVDTVTQELYHVGQAEKISLLLGILKREKPRNTLIFTNMKSTAVEVAARLEKNGLKCTYIMGDLPQSKRLKIIEGLKSGKIQYLVATNVAARGLHVDDLDLVVNYDLPEDCEDYVHRIGRTARAGKTGKAITLACEQYVHALEGIESFTHMKIPVIWPEDDLYAVDKSAGMRFGSLRSGRGKTSGRERGKTGGRERGKPKDHKPMHGKRAESTGKERDQSLSSPRKQTRDKSSEHQPLPEKLEDRLEYYRRKYGENFKPRAASNT